MLPTRRSYLSLFGLCLAFLLLAAQPSTAQPSEYRLVYRHNESGETLKGDPDQLRRAVRAGLEIRVGWAFRHPERPEVSVEHVADAKFLTILGGDHVMAQIDPIGAQAPDFQKGRIYFRGAQLWVMIASSRGERVSRVTREDGTTEEEVRPQGFSWFVRGTIPAEAGPLWDLPRRDE